ncbi:MAG: T9SS type A sorting domain-containing protein [Bacteroidetes bacterium]|nr:T9SS type A sorting domain-containing protein [Bacteroidota bacterium]
MNCIPNYGQTSFPPLSSLPICDIFNSNACDFYLNIAGKVYADNNTNCNDDPGESVSNSVKVNLYQSGNLIQQNVSLTSGQYDFEVPLGTYTYSVDTTNMPFEVICPPSGEHQSILTPLDSVDLNMDFGLQCKIQDDLGIHTIVQDSGIFRPTQTTLLNAIAGDIAQVYNLNCASGTSGTVTVFFAGPAQFAGIFPGSEIPVVTPNSLTYTIADFGAIDIYNAFKFYMTTDTNTLGIPDVCFTVNVTLLSGDLNPSNNTYTHCFTIWNSFDPNFKEANPVNIIANTAEWLTYTIHFQNTGNAPAMNIVITDTLDANLQESTFTYLQSSHDVFTQVIGNVIKFNFPNINLPDSTNDEPNSHGYVQYKVKIDQGLNVGQTIQNTAAIYFDFNAPIITNTTTNLVVAPTGISEGSAGNYQLIPNPAKNYFHIISGNNSIQQISIFDISGKMVKEIEDYKSGESIDTSNLDAGMYLVKVRNDRYIHTSKLILN